MRERQEMYPLQFIEGFNENEEPATGRFLTWGESGIAIPYVPEVNFSLNRVEIFGAPNNPEFQGEHLFHLHTDFKDKPSNNPIVNGKLIPPSGNTEQWLQILMERAIIVLAHHKYWLTLEEHPLPFSIGLAKEGEALGLRTGSDLGWAASSLGKHKCMLKFYGRFLPVAISPVTKEEAYSARCLRHIDKSLVEIAELMREQKEILLQRNKQEIKPTNDSQKPSADKSNQ